MKDLFTNMIAHELRAPLTAIRGYASLLEEKTPTESDKQHAIRIKESSERMLLILTDLLDVARIQSGKLAIEKKETDVSLVVAKVVAELQVTAREKHIELIQENDTHSCIVMSDSKRLQQVFTNIINNAIKYTQQGSITVSITQVHAFIEIRVKDTGMGIAFEDQKRLFAPFFRVSSTDVSNITGTGLGMWITKELIELLGGSVSVESIKGVGTHVIVKLPTHIRIN
jgi:signal transduction histidine kinase